MFDFDRFQRTATAAVAAILFAAVSVGAAVGPATVQSGPFLAAAAPAGDTARA